ncbi:MAG: hypothetical protein MJK12_06095 [Colwellia sp.]|nr:hypothetical protein [Colwellia sp.]
MANQSPNWDFVQATHLTGETDLGSFNDYSLSGFGVSASKLIGRSLFITANYQNLTSSIGSTDHKTTLDLTSTSVGFGGIFSLTSTTDFYSMVAFESAELSHTFSWLSESQTGYSFSAGIRSMLTSRLEVGGAISYIDVVDETDTSIGVNAFYHFNKSLSVGVSGGLAEHIYILGLSVCYYF